MSVHPVPPTNVAFVFVKPAAYNPAVVALVHEQLAAKGIHITAEGTVPTERIDKEGIIDRHYYTIARYALEMAPFEVVVPGEGAAAFEKSFGQSWLDAVQKGLVINAATAEALLGGVAPLKAAWNLAEKRAKLAPGLYASLIEAECAVKGHYVLNGFYPGNREKFTAPGGAVHWMVVEWEEETLSWASFRAEVIGATNPAAAAPGSIRATLLARWQELGLAAAPDNSDNGVHGSASPIEGLSERRTWLGANPADKFAAYLASKHLDPRFVDALMTNPMAALNGRTQPIFDLLEDRDASIVAALLPEVVLQEGEPAPAAPPAPAVEAVVKVTPAPAAAPAAAAPVPASPAPASAVAQQQLSVASPPQLRPVSPSEGRPVTPYRSPSKMTEREAKLHALRSSTISSQTSEREMRGYFDLFDADHNGFISRDEFKREWALFENYGLNPPQKQLDELFDKFDFKHDGRLSFDEFVLLMCKRVTM